MHLREQLRQFYNDQSKHARYQSIPAFVQEALGYQEQLDDLWRSDKPRYRYLEDFLERISFTSVMDVGANTGYFSLSLAHRFPRVTVYAVEMHANHVQFMQLISRHFHLPNLKIVQKPLLLENAEIFPSADVLLLFNVLHHAGVDFDQGAVTSPADFESYAVPYLSHLIRKFTYLVFQMGYNWGGDKRRPIVAVDDDVQKARLSFRMLQAGGWKTVEIAYPRLVKRRYVYFPASHDYLLSLQNDHLPGIARYLSTLPLEEHSEFYRRPIFICRSVFSPSHH